MNEGVRRSDVGVSEFDASLIAPTERDWALIAKCPLFDDYRFRAKVIADLNVLDPLQTICQSTEEDWGHFLEYIDFLNTDQEMRTIGKRPAISEMARIDAARARASFGEGELETSANRLRRFLDGEEHKDGSVVHIHEWLVSCDLEMTKGIFERCSQTAWENERRYVSWLRLNFPSGMLKLFADLAEVSQEETVKLMEKSDFDLAQRSLKFHREKMEESPYNTDWLIHHLAVLKRLTPLFEQLFVQDSSQFQ